ncbi:MAG: hypothetical protein IT495_08555 [Gammaproteobacteria bacterium]|nr:hypothetical protein [Gammaproteobacteria bacterium]
MMTKRNIELFSAGYPICMQTIELVNQIARPSCEVTILDARDIAVANHAKTLGGRTVPAVTNDGRLASRCAGRGPDEQTLRTAELGRPS